MSNVDAAARALAELVDAVRAFLASPNDAECCGCPIAVRDSETDGHEECCGNPRWVSMENLARALDAATATDGARAAASPSSLTEK